MYPERPRSNWWYLLPIFFSLIGGIIAYFAIRHNDPKKAKKCLYLGIILTMISIIINIGLVGVYESEIWSGVNI